MPIIPIGSADNVHVNSDSIKRLSGSGSISKAFKALAEIDPVLPLILLDGIHYNHHKMIENGYHESFDQIHSEIESLIEK